MGGQGAERAQVRRQHTLVRLFHDRENLIHEQHRRFQKNVGVGLRALLRQIKRIADRIGDILNIAAAHSCAPECKRYVLF